MVESLDPGVLDHLADLCAEPIVWGKTDCAPLVCDHLLEVTGDDLMQGFRVYRTEAERDALLARHGGLAKIVLGVMRDRPGWIPAFPAACAWPGLGLVEAPEGGHAVALALGKGWYLTRVRNGLGFVRDAGRAWAWV